MKKKTANRIKTISAEIQTRLRTKYEYAPISGEELLLSGFGYQEGADKIDPKKIYEILIPVHYQDSSKKRLKRAFKKGGTEAMEQETLSIINERTRR